MVSYSAPLADQSRSTAKASPLTQSTSMQGEAALVGADVERFAVTVLRGQLVVEALVEERAGLLAGIGVVMKLQAVEAEGVGGNGIFERAGAPERCQVGCGKRFEFANARVRALEDGLKAGAGEVGGELFNDGGADGGVVHAGDEQLQDDDVGVLVDDEAGELIGLGKDEAAGVCLRVEQHFAAGQGGLDALAQEWKPGGGIEVATRDEAQGNLRGGAVQGRAEQVAGLVVHRNKARRDSFAVCDRRDGLDGEEICLIDPDVACAEPLGSAPGDGGAGALGDGSRDALGAYEIRHIPYGTGVGQGVGMARRRAVWVASSF
jgi:hypothetical protein